MALIFKSRDLPMNTKLRMLRCYSLSSERLVDIKITKFYVEKVPGDQEGLFKLAIQLTTFFYSVIYNTATGYVLWVYLTDI
jgi:hypothetical protein